ncbi:MAG: glycosyltransferase family 9 protein [Bdellovibrionota bacterium]
MSKSRILILRFSSFGDVTQCLSVASALKTQFTNSEIHWATRQDMVPLLSGHPHISRIWPLDKKQGLKGLLLLAFKLRNEKYSHVYDAHNNLRTFIITFIIRFFRSVKFLRRPMKRWKRFLLFRLRINKFKMPFSGQRDLLEPLAAWGIPPTLPLVPQIFTNEIAVEKAESLVAQFKNNYIALAPSAAFFLKRWPQEYWVKLISLFPDQNFVLLGGPEDRFLEDIARTNPRRILNLSGKSDLSTSITLVKNSKLLVSNDTGLLHVAEQLGKNCIALMGPAPFGFPSRPLTKILELNLNCRPCSKHGQGPCINTNYHECLVGIKPEVVAEELKRVLQCLP